MTTKIFLDSGNPQETKEVIGKFGFLDGQTTNPSLISKNPEVQKCKTGEQVCTEEDLLGFYKDIVLDIRSILDKKQSISIEVYADEHTTAQQMIAQGEEMNTWIPDAHIKLPITEAGLIAARHFVDKGVNVNMTLCFSVEQALAVHEATKGCVSGQVYISPFIGRLDDIGESGITLIKDILNTYRTIGSNVEVLAASIRTKEHVTQTLSLGCDRITIPYKVLMDIEVDDLQEMLNDSTLPREDIEVQESTDYDISHPLTDKGLAKFAEDWKSIFTTN